MNQRNQKLELSVLFVEDESIIRIEFIESLKSYINTVYGAKDGAEGLELYKKHLPDVVITDIKMPNLNGLDMAREIKKIDPVIPIIVVTAYSDSDLLVNAIEIGINHYIIKPINIDKILDALQKSYEIKSLNKRLGQTRDLLTEYKNAIDASSIVIKMDSKGTITYINNEFVRMSGFSREEIVGRNYNSMLDTESQGNLFQEIKKSVLINKYWKGIINQKKKSGEIFYVNATIMPLVDLDSEILQYIAISYDITELIRKEEQLTNQLFTDKLTGLPNRLKLLDDLENKKYSILILINIDSFKEINDFYGTQIGDYILTEAGNKFSGYIQEKKFGLYKLASDEYALLINETMNIDQINGLVNEIRELISDEPFMYQDNEIHLTVTQGVAYSKKDQQNTHMTDQNLILKADMALKRAKKNRRPSIIYDDSLNISQEFENNIMWTRRLKEAISYNKIVPYFQPIVNNISGKIEKYESLVRLMDKDNNAISPIHFLNISKKSRLYHHITRIVLDKSFSVFEQNTYEFSINLSVDDILEKETKEYILNRVRGGNKLNNRLVFEILESEGIENYDEVIEFINEVKGYGCKIAIDDFGSGYSNFDHIMRLNVDYIKIDASITRNINENNNSQLITKLIAEFSKYLEIKTIAEFVSSKEIYEKVKELGVDYSQGYYFGKPEKDILN